MRRAVAKKSRQAHPRPFCVSWKNCLKANCRSTPWQTRKTRLIENIDDAIEMDQPAAATPQMTLELELPQPAMRTAAPLVAQLPADEIDIDDDQPEIKAVVPARQNNLPLMRRRSMLMRRGLMICLITRRRCVHR